MTKPSAIVLDVGTGYTKLGFAGNVEPSDVFPTIMARCEGVLPSRTSSPLDDLEFGIGNEAFRNSTSSICSPLKNGIVNNWDDMEGFLQQCIFRKLRCNPENHNFLLTEPPMNPPENRERLAEVMFETFGVAGMHLGVQAVLALMGSFVSQGMSGRDLTGTVVDSGDGVTHVVPVVDGYVVGSCIKSMPMAGGSITSLVQRLLRERGEPIPPELSLEAARQVKEQHCYVCPDISKEFIKHEQEPGKHHKTHRMRNPRDGKDFLFDIGYERFLGPELFFNPEIHSVQENLNPLPQVVDNAIQACGIDSRRALYNNVVLSGGSTMFKGFGRRMQKDMKSLLAVRAPSASQEVEVKVVTHYNQRYAAWFGGSALASLPQFETAFHTKADYEEHGPSICRANAVFRDI